MILRGARLTEDDFKSISFIVNNSDIPVVYLGIDPGKANGVCGYDENFYIQFMWTIPSDDMTLFLNTFKHIKKCVVERYKLYPNKAKQQTYSDMETSRIIGRIEYWAESNQIDLIMQGANIKNTGYAWLGLKALPKSDPRNHEFDAHVHFMYWAIRNGHVNLRDLIKRGDKLETGTVSK